MKTYLVTATETLYYCGVEIEAESVDEAREKYLTEMDHGMIGVCDSDLHNVTVDEV